MAGRDLIALNVWHYLDAKMANAIAPTLAIVLQDGKDISVTNLIVGKYIRWFLDFKVSKYCEGYSFGGIEDLKFKISEGSDQNLSCPESAMLAVSAWLIRWNF